MAHIVSFTFNPFQENTYILYDNTKECAIIDPGCSTQEEQKVISDFISAKQLKPVKLLNTHCHIDHIVGNAFISHTYKLKLEAHQLEIPVLNAAPEYGTMFGFYINTSPSIDIFLTQGEKVSFGHTSLDILHTPGHSPGSISFVNHKSNYVIAGDALFEKSIGRTDLPLGNHLTLIKSIQEKLFTLSGDMTVYPGHGSKTSIGYEKKYNPFFQ